MKAQITSAEKQILPAYDAAKGCDVSTLMVVTGVDFVNESGETVFHQSYAVLPDVLAAFADPLDYFQKQADAMQADIDHATLNAPLAEASKEADSVISKLLA